MKHATQVETLKKLLELRAIDRDQEVKDEVVQVPVRNYTDPDRLDRELSTAFRNYPMVAGSAVAVREPGSYLMSPWARFPYVVVRDKSGTLRAFLNMCRHRGARLVSGNEECLKAFVCPYHGWTYNLDGSLMSITKEYNFPGVDCEQRGLHELAVTEHAGLIWVHPTPGATIDLRANLGEQICEDFEHFGLEQLIVHRKKTVTLNANWKLLLQTYLDRYHVPVLHRNSIAEFFKQGVIAHHLHGPHIRIAAGLTSLPTAADLDPQAWQILNYASILYTLFPNTYLIVHSNLVSINSFYPVAPDATIWTHEMLYRQGDYEGEEGQEALTQRFANIDRVFQYEDFGTAEGCQAALQPGYGDEHHLLGLEEGLLATFQESVDSVINQPV